VAPASVLGQPFDPLQCQGLFRSSRPPPPPPPPPRQSSSGFLQASGYYPSSSTSASSGFSKPRQPSTATFPSTSSAGLGPLRQQQPSDNNGNANDEEAPRRLPQPRPLSVDHLARTATSLS